MTPPSTGARASVEPVSTPESPRLDPAPGDWRRVSPRYIVVDLVGTLISGLLTTAALAVPWWFVREWWMLLPSAVSAVVMVVTLALVPRRVRAIGYRLRDDDLLFRRGILFQRFAAVPYGRMQLVDISRGPLARAVGLAELKLVTAAASSNLTIPGLPIEDAEALRDHLVAVAETRRAGL